MSPYRKINIFDNDSLKIKDESVTNPTKYIGFHQLCENVGALLEFRVMPSMNVDLAFRLIN